MFGFRLVGIGVLTLGAALLRDKPDAARIDDGMTVGAAAIESAGPLALGPNGTLFVGDSKGAAVFALTMGRGIVPTSSEFTQVDALDAKLASLLGTTSNEIRIRDMVADTSARAIYLSIMRGRGPDAVPAIVRVSSGGAVEAIRLDSIRFSKLALERAPDVDQGFSHPAWRTAKRRTFSVTDLGFADGELFISGVTNEEFASSFRRATYPFNGHSRITQVSMYHTSHGMYETESPIETFLPLTLGGERIILAGYACTPVAKFPLGGLTEGAKVRGTTVLELGDGNRPDDMVAVQQGGTQYVLIVNNRRGLARMKTSDLTRARSLTKQIAETGGVPYQTLSLKGVRAIEPWSNDTFVVLQMTADSTLALRPMASRTFLQ